MKTPLKRVLIIFTILISFVILSVVLLPSIIDLGKYKGRIEGFISEAFKRDVSIREIRLSILGGIGAELKDIMIGKNPELIDIESMTIKVSIVPLLQKRIEMKGVSLRKIRVFLKKEGEAQNMIVISNLYLPLTSFRSDLAEFKGFSADLYKGRFFGDLKIEKGEDESRYSLVYNIDKVEMESLIKDTLGQKATISGPLKLEGHLKGKGGDLERIEGAGFLNVGKGKIKGIELVDIIGSVGIIKSKRPISLRDYDRISGHYTIGGGYLRTEDLEMAGKDLHLKAKGSYGLINSKLDFLVKGLVIDVPVEVKVGGTSSNPTYSLRSSGIEKKAIEGLGKELGKGKGEKKEVDEILKGLFR